MDKEKDKTSADTGENGHCNNGLIITTKSLEVPVQEAGHSIENEKNSDTGTLPVQLQATTPTASTTEVGGLPDKSETKSANNSNTAMLGEQTKVVINEDILVKNVSAVQVGNNNAMSSDNDRQDSAIVQGATASLPSPGKVLVYQKCNIQIEKCNFVQVGNNNRMVIDKTTPQEDAFVNACCELDIDPKTADDITKKLSNKNILEQFAKKMAETYNVTCKIRGAKKGCILLELEVPTEEDRLQLLRMARDGTFQQVLLETFLPEFAAEGRAVNMNLAIGVRNPSQAMVEELHGATASGDHEDVVVVEISAATNDPSASKQDQSELTKGEHSKDDPADLAEGHKNLAGEEVPDVALSKPALYTEDAPTPTKKLLPDPDDGEGEITVSVEGYAEGVALGTGAAAAEGFDDKFLTCDICQNIYQDPRVLPCGHTFCAKCLETWRKRKSEFTCPTCRYEVRLQGTPGVTSLPVNFQINHLLDYRASQNVKEGQAQCQMCESGARVGLCTECYMFLCKNCIAIHGKTPALKDHHITLLDSPTEYCPKHINQPMTFYCQPCAKLVCQDCVKNEHQSGLDHDPQEVSKVAEETKVALQTLVGEIEAELKGTEYILEQDLICARTNFELQKKKIQEHFAQLRAKLEKEEQEMTIKLKQMNDKLQDSLLEERKNFEDTVRPTEDRLQFYRDVLAKGSDVQISTLGQQLEGNLNKLKTEEIPHRRLGSEIVLSMKRDMETFRCSPGYLNKCPTKYKTTDLPVESLATTIIFDASFPSQIQYTNPKSGAASQVTVIPDAIFESLKITPRHNHQVILSDNQCDILDTTRISEGLFEAVWRPLTSGKHVVGITIKCQRQGIVEWLGEVPSFRPHNHVSVDVGSNNPVLRFGQEGNQQGQFDRPIDVAVRGDRLYVADTFNKRVQVFDLNGKFCNSFPMTTNPESIAVQTNGTIVVRSGQEVEKFSPLGELLHKFPLGEYCTDPYGLAVQRDGRVIVTDPRKHSIFLFEADGTLVKQVWRQGVGQFDQSGFVCVDREDNIIVADSHNHCVQVFDKGLNFQHKFGQFGRQPQDMWWPTGVSADSRGNIVLANLGDETGGVRHSKKLQVFRPDGTLVSTISSDGDKLNLPHGVAVTGDGHVFVADTKDHCIRKYRYM